MRIFVSYAAEDVRVAHEMATRLTAAGHSVFFDRNSLPAGRAFDHRLREEVDAAGFFIFLISRFALQGGKYALTELGWAERNWAQGQTTILPVLIGQEPKPEAIPPILSSLTWLRPKGSIVAEVVSEVNKLEAVTSDGRRPIRPRLVTVIMAFLAIVATVWFLGHVVWVLYALRHQLGWLDPWAIKGRAVATGLVPALILASLGFVCWGLLAHWRKRDSHPFESTISGALTMMFVTGTVDHVTGTKDRVYKWIAVSFIGTLASLTLLSALESYVRLGFDKVPQELGGPGTRCVTLDVNTSAVSELTRVALNVISINGESVRTRPLELILETKENAYLRWFDGDMDHPRYSKMTTAAIVRILDAPQECVSVWNR